MKAAEFNYWLLLS